MCLGDSTRVSFFALRLRFVGKRENPLVGPGAVANQKSNRKLTKYRDLSDRYDIRPFAVETLVQ